MAQGSSVAGGEDSSVARPNRRDSEEVERMGSHELYSDSLEKAAEQNSGGYFGAVNIYNSEDVLVGNKAVLNGDVTINQYIYPNGIKEINPLTDHLAKPEDVTICTKNGNIKLNNGKKPHPVVQITQQNSIEKGLVREWWRWMSCTFAGALMVVLVLLFAWWWLRSFGDDPQKAVASPKQYPFVIPDNLTDEDTSTFVEENLYRFVNRTDWLAQPSLEITNQTLPVDKVIVTHTATEGCFSRQDCINIVKFIQEFHMGSRGWSDIAYNFLVSGDGDIYVGRGWENYGSHTKGYNIGSIGLAFIGTFTNEIPTIKQVEAAGIFIKISLILNKITEDYELYAHRQLINTDSPGVNVYNIIKQWPHWKNLNTDTDQNNTMETLHEVVS